MSPSSLAFVQQPGILSTQTTPAITAPLLLLPSSCQPRHSSCPCRQRYTRLFYDTEDDYEEDLFLQRELARIESLGDDAHDDPLYDAEEEDMWLDEILLNPDDADLQEMEELERTFFGLQLEPKSAESLEQALLQGVVPAQAGVGSGCLAGDFGFDPLKLSEKDYIGDIQRCIVNLLPGAGDNNTPHSQKRPSALVLRDYREAEIRHGRLAMLAAVIWPLQEMLDRLVLDDYGSFLFGGQKTLAYFPLLMTAVIMLLGYLDIYSQAIKEWERVGEAFLPGDCFWDPLKMLEGAPDSMKRNMQERELFNGRTAMLAVAVYLWEEALTGKPIIDIAGNELLFEPAYQIPYIQEWLDVQFGIGGGPTTTSFTDVPVDDLTQVLDELVDSGIN